LGQIDLDNSRNKKAIIHHITLKTSTHNTSHHLIHHLLIITELRIIGSITWKSLRFELLGTLELTVPETNTLGRCIMVSSSKNDKGQNLGNRFKITDICPGNLYFASCFLLYELGSFIRLIRTLGTKGSERYGYVLSPKSHQGETP